MSPALRRLRGAHAAGFAVSCWAGAAAGALLPTPSLERQLLVLAAGLALLGIPHGAADWHVGRALFGRERAWAPRFALAYAGLAAAVVGVWTAAPVASLGVFLLLSALHFGAGDAGRGAFPPAPGSDVRLLRGALPIALPLAFHPEAVLGLFAWLAPPLDAFRLGEASSAWLRGVCLAGAAWAALRHLWRVRTAGWSHAAAAAEVMGLTAAALALSPLLFFALYFCLGHAARHTIELIARVEPGRPGATAGRLARDAAAVTLLTVAGGALALPFADAASTLAPAATRVIFVGLAALTVPHMLLTALFARRGGGLARR